MSDVFHKICYTSRSSGYKYRTLSTNTGKRRRRDTKDESTFDRKFRELKNEIVTRIDDELDLTQEARDHIDAKFEKVQGKIESMLELQEVMVGLKNDLRVAENNLANLILRVDKLDAATGGEEYSLHSRRSFFQPKTPMMEIIETNDSITTHI
ncbi:uncharacterized protein LOC106134871 [Amyelois transitella]|uniref:uncharacterized protein LOC106134871 n=1 Tax=Amyelois transitella TaxID=680683 RepID=UPI0029905525|nr:uncharacterized protein LOC106134871 [Amyelois transitella]